MILVKVWDLNGCHGEIELEHADSFTNEQVMRRYDYFLLNS